MLSPFAAALDTAGNTSSAVSDFFDTMFAMLEDAFVTSVISASRHPAAHRNRPDK